MDIWARSFQCNGYKLELLFRSISSAISPSRPHSPVAHSPLVMFSSIVRTALSGLVLSAIAASAAPGLSLHVSGPDSVDGVQNLKVVTTVTNTGDETLKLLNDPRGPLNKLPAETFAISDAAGAVPSFTGIKVKYVPANAVAVGKEDAFTVLTPGQSIDVEHDCTSLSFL